MLTTTSDGYLDPSVYCYGISWFCVEFFIKTIFVISFVLYVGMRKKLMARDKPFLLCYKRSKIRYITRMKNVCLLCLQVLCVCEETPERAVGLCIFLGDREIGSCLTCQYFSCDFQ